MWPDCYFLRGGAYRLEIISAPSHSGLPHETSEKHDTAEGSHIVLSQIDTLHCQQKELEHKGGQR